ncbi:MAG: CinA family nicotinamide mononucleotide deamidase-related protein [Thermoanaerobaculia bacterium]
MRVAKAAILAVGSELLGTERLDTNSLALTGLFDRYGVALRSKGVVGDDEEVLATEIAALVGKVELLVLTGGLGPTADDITRPAVARALGRSYREVPELSAAIERRFASMGLVMPEVNRRQAELIDGGTSLANERGSAPGMMLEERGTRIYLFPGVPFELSGMMERYLEPWLAAEMGEVSRETVVVKVACLPESAVEERIAPAYGEFGRENITILAKPGDIELRASASGPEAERRSLLERMRLRLAELVGPAVYAFGEGQSLELALGRLLAEQGRTLVTAESCTGGLMAERITRVPGSSAYFLGGAVTYANQAKVELLGVPAELIERHGAVSEEVARAMAEGGRRRFGADYCLAATGVAGPGGGSETKPVGTVHLAMAGPEGRTDHRRVNYPVERERVRFMASQVAFEMLRRRLAEPPVR